MESLNTETLPLTPVPDAAANFNFKLQPVEEEQDEPVSPTRKESADSDTENYVELYVDKTLKHALKPILEDIA